MIFVKKIIEVPLEKYLGMKNIIRNQKRMISKLKNSVRNTFSLITLAGLLDAVLIVLFIFIMEPQKENKLIPAGYGSEDAKEDQFNLSIKKNTVVFRDKIYTIENISDLENMLSKDNTYNLDLEGKEYTIHNKLLEMLLRNEITLNFLIEK